MKVVILCGGLGTRLREETEFRPKPMVKIGAKPILWHIMSLYAAHGYRDFVLCLGYRGEAIKEYFYDFDILTRDFTITFGAGKQVEVVPSAHEDGWRVSLVDTGETALKGARIKRVEHLIDGDEFMLTYGDGLADIDVRALVEFHRSHGKIATVTGVRPPSLFGEIQVEEGGHAALFSEKPQTSSGTISGGFFVFSKRFLEYVSAEDDCDFERGPLEKLSADGELMVYQHPGSWACMDTPRDVELLNRLWREGRAFWKVWA